MLNACFDVAVTSEAMDGAAPELPPAGFIDGKNSNIEAQHSAQLQSIYLSTLRADRLRSQLISTTLNLSRDIQAFAGELPALPNRAQH